MLKDFLVTFGRGSRHQVTYQITAETKKAAKEEFSIGFIGRNDSTLVGILECEVAICGECNSVMLNCMCPVCD